MVKNKEDFGSIIRKEKLRFKNEKDLEKYYYNKYKKEGYKKGGYKIFGINVSNIYHKERFKNSLNFLNPKKEDIILDAGCGEGELTRKIARKCKKVIGVDIAKSALKTARKNSPKNCIFRYGSLEKLEFSKNYFDKIVCVETIEHVLHPKKVIKEFKRVLKKKGKLVLCVPTIDTTTLAKILIFFGIADLYPVSEHLSEWDYKGIKRLVEKYNFELIKSIGICFDFRNLFGITKLNKKINVFTRNLSLSIKRFPKNSLWVVLLFEKK
jgi:ubiquinone/menaquinone biosynthesis C-methylase UbiE